MYKKTLSFIIPFILLSFGLSAQNFTEAEAQSIRQFKYEITSVTQESGLKILKSKSEPISTSDDLLPELVSQLLRMVAQEEGVGIAAPQIGINRQVFIIQRFDIEGDPFEEIINPKILWRSELMQKGPEGCLSIPDFRQDIWRHYTIHVQYETLSGKVIQQIMEGFTAVIFQHEYDHLIGRLITDDEHIDVNNRILPHSTSFGILKP